VLLNGADELERVNAIEVQAGQSSLRNVIFLLIVNVAFVLPIYVYSQLKPFREDGKTVTIPSIRAWSVMIRKILKAPTTSSAFRQLAVVIDDSDIHSARINDCKVRTPRRGVWVAERINEGSNDS